MAQHFRNLSLYRYLSFTYFICIRKTSFKQLIVCIQFRPDYPASPLSVELKSKTLSTKLLDGLADVCEKECKGLLNKAQVVYHSIILVVCNIYFEVVISCVDCDWLRLGIADFEVHPKLH